MLTALCVAVDWGTSNFRLWVIDEKGNVLNTIIDHMACHFLNLLSMKTCSKKPSKIQELPHRFQ